MTTQLLGKPVKHMTAQATALSIIDHYRHAVHDYTRLDTLKSEFPSLTRQLTAQGAGNLWLLRTDDNDAGTFKWRGAIVAMSRMAQQGIVSFAGASAGNHALGMAVATRELLRVYPALHVYIAVPTTAPASKREGVRERCRSPQLEIEAKEGDDTFDKTYNRVLAHPELGTLVSPFDDPNVIEGQGTIAADIMRLAHEPVDHLVMPVGGGGLLAGVLQELERLGNTHTHIHVVEPKGSDSLSRSLHAKKQTIATRPNQQYGGSAVSMIGKHTFKIIQRFQDRLTIHSASDKEVDFAVATYLQDKSLGPHYERTTLAVLPALEKIVKQHPNKSVVMIGTGHNAPL